MFVFPEALGPIINVTPSENSNVFEPKFRKLFKAIFPIIVSQLYNNQLQYLDMQKNPLISVIIPAHNEEAFIRKCLDSLSKQTLEKKLFEVIVINNASKDGTAGIARKYNVRVINEERKSVVLARQKGVDVAKGEIIVSADADTVYPQNWLKKIKADFDKNQSLIAVVGWIYYTKTPAIFNIFNALNQEVNLFLQKYTGRFPIAYAANLAFRKAALTAIGGYPKHLVELGDQQYLLYRFFRLGKVVIDPGIRCFTSGRRLQSVGRDIFVYNGWYRIVGYIINRLTKKETIGAAPAVRTITSGTPGKNKFRVR
jgi:glycosyltransferase involved in cell wall biosynthesis